MFVEKIVSLCIVMPFAWVLYALMRKFQDYNNGIILGVSLPEQQVSENTVEHIRREYQKYLLLSAILCALLFFAVFADVSKKSLTAFIFLWILFSGVVLATVYSVFHMKLREYKRKTAQIQGDTLPNDVMADTELAKRRGISKKKRIAIAIIVMLSLAPFLLELLVVHGKHVMLSLFPFLSVLLLLVFLFILLKVRSHRVSGGLQQSIASNACFRDSWFRFWIEASISFVVFFTYYYATSSSAGYNGEILTPLVFIFCFAYVVLRLLTTILKLQSKRSSDFYYSSNVEDKYIGGIFYYNPHDKKLFVPSIYNIGVTVNFANPLSYAIIVAVSILAATVIFYLFPF